jgi:hypothetical protein
MGKPDFFILGAQRAGTTSLSAYLNHHPNVCFPQCHHPIEMRTKEEVHVSVGAEKVYVGRFQGGQAFCIWEPGQVMKEPSYFSRFHHIMSLDDYFSLFDNNGNGRYGFDASPEYLDTVGVEERIKEICPDAKFIIMLRDPVKRIWSHYWHEVEVNKSETLPFEEAIQRTAGCYCSKFFFAYLSRGQYADHLERWFSVFPRDRFRIYFMEEFFANTQGYFIDVQSWLGLKPVVCLEKYPSHSTMSEGYPKINKDTERVLSQYYAPFNERLRVLLGRKELPW